MYFLVNVLYDGNVSCESQVTRKVNNMTKQTKELIANYIQGYDRTVIFEHTYLNNECIKIELVGWYFGEPNEDNTKQFANRNYVCKF